MSNAFGSSSATVTPAFITEESSVSQRSSSTLSSISQYSIKNINAGPSIPSSPVRRKPLPPNVTPLNINTSVNPQHHSIIAANNSQSLTSTSEEEFTVRDLDKHPHGASLPPPLPLPVKPLDSQTLGYSPRPPINAPSDHSNHSRLVSEPLNFNHKPNAITQNISDHKRSLTMALHPPSHAPSTRPPPLRFDSTSRNMSNGSNDYKQPPKTPGNKITSFFGWKTATSPGAESSGTDISESILSPLPSPLNAPTLPSTQASQLSSRDSFYGPGSKTIARSPTMPTENKMLSKLAELENELRDISSELAGSIRREMELEDLVEKLQSDPNVSMDPSRRTSDYFSDSGTSSIKYPLSDAGSSKLEDMEKLKRTLEQERAQLKIDLSQRWQEETSRRQVAESHVQILENQVNQFRREKVDASNIAAKTKELETALEDTRRRLTEERQIKDNFEDLLTAMRVELEQQSNEKDQLQARMQQEILALRNENNALSQGRKMPFDMQQPAARINSIAEEGGFGGSMISGGLSRSNSLARVPPKNSLSRSGSLTRPSSVIGKDREFRESLVDRVKDVETQRDALHQTVKSLLERQAYQTRQHEKQIRMMEVGTSRSRLSGPPRKKGYERDVRGLREEINLLRRRADDALEQKWRCEKGLGGLKMDLDRAEQETSSLRTLLQEHDIPVPEHLNADSDSMVDFHATASSLEDAYNQLKAERADIEATGSPVENDALERQVQQQVVTNSSLRSRLSRAINQGEHEQKSSAVKINEMQSKLRLLEETLMLAQQHSEEEVGKHEQEIFALKESHSAQLLRAKNGVRSPAMLSPILPNSPFSGPRSPALAKTRSGEAMGLNQVAQTENLETKVKALERALRDADAEMEEVVSRMNKAQIEVAELQTDRDEALRHTRRLQSEVLTHRQKSK